MVQEYSVKVNRPWFSDPNFDYRRGWIVARVQQLAALFAIDMAALEKALQDQGHNTGECSTQHPFDEAELAIHTQLESLDVLFGC